MEDAPAEMEPSNEAGGATALKGFTCLWINDVTPGREEEYVEKIIERVVPLYRKHGVDLLGLWSGGLGPKSNQVIVLIDYHTLDQFNSLYTDPEYVAMDAEMGFKQMRSNQGWFLNPTRYSAPGSDNQ